FNNTASFEPPGHEPELQRSCIPRLLAVNTVSIRVEVPCGKELLPLMHVYNSTGRNPHQRLSRTMTESRATNIHIHAGTVNRSRRDQINRHRGFTLWFTGLSGSGKSTLSVALEERLHGMGCRTYRLDGDNVRTGLNRDLAFSPEDRIENIRRIRAVAKLFRDAGTINLVAFIPPYRRDRQVPRALSYGGDFIEIYVAASLDVCEQRDPKGLYQKARAGTIPNFTGISAPYEAPENPELHVHTDTQSLAECVEVIVDYLLTHDYIDRALQDVAR